MRQNKTLFKQLAELTTEQRNRKSVRLDTLSVNDMLQLIHREDKKVAAAVGKEIKHIAGAVELVVKSLKAGGRLIYVGAGTSGRLGVLDAAECPPTFGTDPSTVQALIAGGPRSVFRSKEGAEDDEKSGAADMRQVRSKDVVCGIAASVRTPYVHGALGEAKRRGAKVIFLTTNPRSVLRQAPYAALRRNIDVAICPHVGPEILMGSTRMKSGTAQKLVLNMLTTASMVRMGKVYENMMIDLRMTSRKLEERAKRVLMMATAVDYNKASRILRLANGHVKTGIVMIMSDVSAAAARARLRKASGFVRYAIKNVSYKN